MKQPNGILIVDKPQGLTSHDVIDKVRAIFGMRRVGHSGTLDPLATGVLVVLLGEATKLFTQFSNFDKEYVATLTLGSATDTGDSLGKIIKKCGYNGILNRDVENALHKFQGVIYQVPPMVSAIKYKGKKLYQLARQGIEIKRSARMINIHEIKLIDLTLPDIVFYVRCSKGTYIRKLGEEIAEVLGSVGHISKIQRLSLGPFNIRDAVSLEDLNESHIRSWPS